MIERTFVQMKASRTSMAVVTGVFTLPLLICMLAAIKHPAMWIAVLICVTGIAFVLIWLKYYEVEVADGTLKYSSLFSRPKYVQLDSIVSAKIEVGYRLYRDRFKAPLRLVISTCNDKSDCSISINLKVFSKQDVESLLLLLDLNKTQLGR